MTGTAIARCSVAAAVCECATSCGWCELSIYQSVLSALSLDRTPARDAIRATMARIQLSSQRPLLIFSCSLARYLWPKPFQVSSLLDLVLEAHSPFDDWLTTSHVAIF
jgi:hypothetical protein